MFALTVVISGIAADPNIAGLVDHATMDSRSKRDTIVVKTFNIGTTEDAVYRPDPKSAFVRLPNGSVVKPIKYVGPDSPITLVPGERVLERFTFPPIKSEEYVFVWCGGYKRISSRSRMK